MTSKSQFYVLGQTGPWIGSMDPIHGSDPWIKSMDQIHGSDPKGSQGSPKKVPRRPKQAPRGPKRPQGILQQKQAN